VVAVLLAAPRVPARRLEVPARIRADPDVGPGRGDGQGADSLPLRPTYRLVLSPEVVEASAGATAPDAGLDVADVAQTGGPGRFARVVKDIFDGIYLTAAL